MTKNSLLRCVATLAILSGTAKAQFIRVQNFDISFLWATSSLPSQTVPDSNVTVGKSWPISCCSVEIGYQIARTPVGYLWAEFANFHRGGSLNASIPSSGNRDLAAEMVGLRLMFPVGSRVSIFGAAGGGDGEFHYPFIVGASSPELLSRSTTHGVFDWGGGLDLRLSKRISLRGEVRDLVSGKGLSGSDGVHHVLALVGMGLHF